MKSKLQEQFSKLLDNIIAYLPNLLGGILLILLGWLAGWIIKRLIIQFLIIMRVGRFLKRSRWESDFSKADVRYGIFNFVGNIGFAIVFIIFVGNALFTWRLNILSGLLNRGVLLIPKIIVAFIIIVAGWLLASWIQLTVLKTLFREQVPRATLISKFIKGMLILFFAAIAFVEIGIAREVVIIGFSALFITLCIIAIAIVIPGRKDILKKPDDIRSITTPKE